MKNYTVEEKKIMGCALDAFIADGERARNRTETSESKEKISGMLKQVSNLQEKLKNDVISTK